MLAAALAFAVAAGLLTITPGLDTMFVVNGVAWFGVITAASARMSRLLRRPAVKRWLDRVTGCVFLGFGARLAFEGSRLAPR